MSKESLNFTGVRAVLGALALALPALSVAQVPVDENGNTIGQFDASGSTAAETADQIPLLSATELEELVGPYALYPDDLLAIVLPASTYPLQLVQAQRFLEDLKTNPSLKPDDSWDDSVVALVNYPEALELMTEDLDKTWRLGEAVVAQQADVIAAVESFRDRAYAAGNLKSDSYQTVSQDDGVIEISPVEDDVIYVPYYEPRRVVVYQPRPVYYYHPRPYPVYYYPYPYGHSFHSGYFWGVTTAFTVGWYTNHLHVHHHSYHGHPYHGRKYWRNYWYRRPNIHVHNNYYYNDNYVRNRFAHGDYWRPRTRHTVNPNNHRVTRSRYYPGSNTQIASSERRDSQGSSFQRQKTSPKTRSQSGRSRQPDIQFKPRTSRNTPAASARPGSPKPASQSVRKSKSPRSQEPDVKFRSRSSTEKRVATARPSSSKPASQSVRKSKSPRAQEPDIKFRSRPNTEKRVASTRPSSSARRSSSPRVSQPKASAPRTSQAKSRVQRSSPPKVSAPRQSKPSGRSSGSTKVASGSRKHDKSRTSERRRR